MVRFYRDKHQIDMERKNTEFWLLGGYFYNALLDVAPVLVPFNKNPNPSPYLDKPIRLTPESEEEKETRLFEETRKKLGAYLSNFKPQQGG